MTSPAIPYLDTDGLPVDEEMVEKDNKITHLVSLCPKCNTDDSWIKKGVVVQVDCGKWIPSTRDGRIPAASAECVPCIMAPNREFCANCGRAIVLL